MILFEHRQMGIRFRAFDNYIVVIIALIVVLVFHIIYTRACVRFRRGGNCPKCPNVSLVISAIYFLSLAAVMPLFYPSHFSQMEGGAQVHVAPCVLQRAGIYGVGMGMVVFGRQTIGYRV